MYIRFQSPTPGRRGVHTGVFGLTNALGRSGQLSPIEHADWRAGNDWFNAAYPNPTDTDRTVYDADVNPLAASSMRTRCRWSSSRTIRMRSRRTTRSTSRSSRSNRQDEPMALETPEEFYARIQAATDDEGRLPVAVEEMPGWDIYPYEIDSLRVKPLQPLADEEPPRGGEDPADCWCAPGSSELPRAGLAWLNERWRLVLGREAKVPIFVILEPLTHCDLATVPDDLAAEMGRLVVEIAAAVEDVPTVGRAQLYRFGDGGAHLHLMFLGRPRRVLQLRGSPLLDWEENLPRVPDDVHRANAAYVGSRLAERVGGSGPDWLD
jgi:hypothetical protein